MHSQSLWRSVNTLSCLSFCNMGYRTDLRFSNLVAEAFTNELDTMKISADKIMLMHIKEKGTSYRQDK